jgi:hypothetical protein
MMIVMIFSGLFGALALLFFVLRQSLWSVLNVPRQVTQLVHGLAVRRNHAIEHATVNVLAERYGQQLVDGCATTEGFRIRAAIDPALLLDAAREGLLRLQRGDRALAIHGRCTTALLLSYAVVSTSLISLLATTHAVSPQNLALVLVLTVAATPKISRLVQRFLTTSMDVKGMTIGAVELVPPTLFMGLAFNGGAEFAVRTKPERRIYHPPYRYGERVPVYVPVENRERGR